MALTHTYYVIAIILARHALRRPDADVLEVQDLPKAAAQLFQGDRCGMQGFKTRNRCLRGRNMNTTYNGRELQQCSCLAQKYMMFEEAQSTYNVCVCVCVEGWGLISMRAQHLNGRMSCPSVGDMLIAMLHSFWKCPEWLLLDTTCIEA